MMTAVLQAQTQAVEPKTELHVKRHTLAEYRAWCEQPQHAERLYELIDGEIVEKMGSYTPSRIAGRILTFIGIFLLQTKIGTVTGADGTYELSDSDALIPDVAYISNARLPEDPARSVPIPPDLAVEVKSPTDTFRALRRKAERYIALGTPLVWLVFPETQTVEVYVSDPAVDVLTIAATDTLDGGAVLPGFTLAVTDIFTR